MQLGRGSVVMDLEPVLFNLEVNHLPQHSFSQLHQLVVVPVMPKKCKRMRKKKRKEKTTPFGGILRRSLVIYQAAQEKA